MQLHTGKRAIIIGGGIGGLTTAIALRCIGMDVAVFERAVELREVGSGLPLWTNALQAFHALGLTSIIESLGQPVSTGCITDWRGDILADVRTEHLLAKLGTISMVVHRAELHSALLNVLGKSNISLGATCIGYTLDATGVSASFADGRVVRGDILIGADGLHSTIRRQLFGATKPRYAGYTCWRGIAHTTRTDIETWAWGKGNQFGITPMSNERAYWFAQRYATEGEADQPIGRKREVFNLFHDWHDPIPEIIAATKEIDILRNDVYECTYLTHWSRGRIALLGDAAHVMTPNLGQGACIAIEDAVELANCLATEKDEISALHAYEMRRVKRANTIAWAAGAIGRAVQIENTLLAKMRNIMLKKVPSPLLLQQLMWILDYQCGPLPKAQA